MELKLELYSKQNAYWPEKGRHILAQYDENSVVVYQAYCPSIARFAVKHQFFGGYFSYTRMSWIKTNFLWMMYRSGWASKEGQERVLAIRLKRAFFESLLKSAAWSSFSDERYTERASWQEHLAQSPVRLQWDPDHDPFGVPQERRAIQLGLKDAALAPFRGEAIMSIEDITSFVHEQHNRIRSSGAEILIMPTEAVYQPHSLDAVANICLSTT